MPDSKAKLPPKSQPQVAKFRDMAREFECDEDEAAFKAKLKAVAKAAPQKASGPDKK